MKEDPDNILLVCKECSEKRHPNKGKLDVSVGQFAKLKFIEENRANRAEYMWVKVTNADGVMGEYEGTLSNEPIYIETIKYGDRITFKKEDIYDVSV